MLEGLEAEIAARYQAGESMSHIGKSLGTTESAIRRRLRKLGVQSRSRAEAGALVEWSDERRAKQREVGKQSGAASRGRRYTHEGVIKRPGIQGAKNGAWKGGRTTLGPRIRGCPEYRQWRDAVFARDAYTCQYCGAATGNGHRVALNADHVYPLWRLLDDHAVASMEDALRCVALWDVGNGRTLCHPCHRVTPTYGHNARNTSRTCPDCGIVAPKALSQRVHSCACGCVMDRDVAAAKVVLHRGLGCSLQAKTVGAEVRAVA